MVAIFTMAGAPDLANCCQAVLNKIKASNVVAIFIGWGHLARPALSNHSE